MSDEYAIAQDVAGRRVCMYGTADNYCGKPAVMHIMQNDEVPTMDCPEHAKWWDSRQYVDYHLIGPDCGMPGVHWRENTDGMGTCLLLLDAYPDGAE